MQTFLHLIQIRRLASKAAVACFAFLLTGCFQQKAEEVVPVIKPDGVTDSASLPTERTTNDTDPDTGKYFVRPAPMLELQFGPKWKSQGLENPDEQSKMLRMPNGILYRDILVGYGLPPHLRATVICHYIAYRPDGSIFDSSVDRGMPLVFVLGSHEVMAGLQGGLINMQVGGVRKVVVPPRLCIGKLGKKTVPNKQKMIMMLRLLSVDQNYESSPPREVLEESSHDYLKREAQKMGEDTSTWPDEFGKVIDEDDE